VKPQDAALGFRVKSGWAVAVLLAGTTRYPALCDVRRIDLSDPRVPETRQPYHAATGKLETDSRKLTERVDIVRRIAEKSIAELLATYRQKDYRIRRAAIVVGSDLNPDFIANPHIRAHAFEGQLFRSVLKECLRTNGIEADVLRERDAYGEAAVKLKQRSESVRSMVRAFGLKTQSPWRAEQKLAAVAAWLALR
jgi:hypothetical protein